MRRSDSDLIEQEENMGYIVQSNEASYEPVMLRSCCLGCRKNEKVEVNIEVEQ
jgi:hypothetical protein